jgi:aldehyde dehydrogenase (NAD+)
MRSARNYVNGRWVWAASGETGTRENPADPTETVVEYARSSQVDVEEAVAAAHTAFDPWRRQATGARAALISTALDQLERRVDEIALAITLENGKILAEARAEATRSIAAARFLVGLSRTLDSRVVRSETPGVIAWSRIVPIGVAVAVTPWNYPLSSMIRKVVSAMLAGATVIHKPAEITPLTASIVFEAFDEARIPAGVANLLLGPGPRLGPMLAASHDVRAISFTGSTEVGMSLASAVAGRDCKIQLEMGGKNALVVLADANIDEAVDAAVVGGYTCSGQWCAATSRVIVEEQVAPIFVDGLSKRVSAMRVGDGRQPGTTIGPVVSSIQFDKINRYVESGSDVAKSVATPAAPNPDTQGYFVSPVVFDGVPPDHPLATEEVFGPVVSVIHAKDAEDAFHLVNASKYGLTASVYTSSLARALEFIDTAQVGRVAVNLHTAFGEPGLSGQGFKDSGRGEPEGGEAGIAFFGQPQAVYIRSLPEALPD